LAALAALAAWAYFRTGPFPLRRCAPRAKTIEMDMEFLALPGKLQREMKLFPGCLLPPKPVCLLTVNGNNLNGYEHLPLKNTNQ
jgi:hypothetical protein